MYNSKSSVKGCPSIVGLQQLKGQSAHSLGRSLCVCVCLLVSVHSTKANSLLQNDFLSKQRGIGGSSHKKKRKDKSSMKRIDQRRKKPCVTAFCVVFRCVPWCHWTQKLMRLDY